MASPSPSIVVEVAGAFVSGGLALLADAEQMLTDVAGLTHGLIAAVFSRRPTTDARTWGYRRAEVLGAPAQAAVLLVAGVFVLAEAVRRLFSPEGHLPGDVGLRCGGPSCDNRWDRDPRLGPRGEHQHASSPLEILNYTFGSVAVLAAAAVIAPPEWLRGRGGRLPGHRDPDHPAHHQAAGDRRPADGAHPKGLELAAVQDQILTLPHVDDVHDLHASRPSPGSKVPMAHVVVDDSWFQDGHLARCRRATELPQRRLRRRALHHSVRTHHIRHA